MAHWPFDEPSGGKCQDASGHRWHATFQHGTMPTRQRGVLAGALTFSGNHLIRVESAIPLAHPAGISLAAWTKPSVLSVYREIFRKEDGDQRVLFSFQHDGALLTLGLNINGYIECRAAIPQTKRLPDGRWHHCAATFDGQTMRVYLDGEQIGSLERKGTIRSAGGAPACIGSSNGGECFQGSLDDLRIYAGPLPAEEILRLYQQGRAAIEHSSAQLAKNIRETYQRKDTFAATLMAARRHIVEHSLGPDRELAAAIVWRLQKDFANDVTRWAVTQTPLADFLADPAPDAHVKLAQRMVALRLEYKPLTESQWKKQTPEDRRRWTEADAAAARLAQRKAQGPAAAFSPDWIDLIEELASGVQFRPMLSEPVAPYIPPETPVTRSLSAVEAQDAMERDWLFQADGRPSPERIRQEIDWTRRLAQRLSGGHPARFAASLAELAQLVPLAAAARSVDTELYFRVRRIKREIALANPAITFQKLLLVDMPFPQGREWRHETRHRLGYMAVPGGRLLVLDGLKPDGRLTQLMPQAPLHGSFWRPDVSFDGTRIVFCFKPHNEKSFHLYEIRADGTGLVQLTDGPYDDFDPIYLPDEEHLMFSTTRGHTYVRCMPPTNAFILARCNRDGHDIYLVSQNNEPDYLPSVMHDGRVIYTRWEYTDKPLWRAQKLWTVHPDGTHVSMYWGNQSVWPDLMKDVRAIPGSRRVMFTGCGHHDWFAGSVGIIDPDKGFNFPHGLTKITAEVAWPEVGNGPVDPIESPDYHTSGRYHAYFSPYPLSEKDFLVSAEREGKFRLYLMDIDGNRELIYEGVHNAFHAIPLAARRRPPVMADQVVWPTRENRLEPKGGVIFSNNVYANASDELRGKAKYLRVFSIDPKTYTYWHKRPYLSTGPVVSIVQSEGVKRLLGTVPIEADGSVAFRAPPGKPLHFQLLDSQFRALQTMRSFVGVMPGEQRGCLGCHESHSWTPDLGRPGLALRNRPQTITPPAWGVDTVSYPRYVRPVLDKYCSQCHEGNHEGRKTLDLTPRPGFLEFDESYALITGRPTWGKAYQMPTKPPPGFGLAGVLMVEGYRTTDPQAYLTPPPMTRLSLRSPLVELAASGKHYGVKVDPISLQKLITWVDAMCPYNGDDEVRAIDDPVFQGVDWLSIRPRIKTAPVIVRPGPVD